MTLRFYQHDFTSIHLRSRKVLESLGYQIQEQDLLNGILRAVREEPAGATSHLMDLRLKREPDGLQLLVLSGCRSNVFGIIYSGPDAETEFIDHLLFEGAPAVVRPWEFRLTEAEYAFASGF
jgi:hypothetical protein